MALLFPLTTFSLDTTKTQFSSTPIHIRPFLLQGETTQNPPATEDTSTTVHKFFNKNKDTPQYSTTPSEYDVMNINSKNIVFGNTYCPSTTLVDLVDTSSPRYSFAFAAFHRNDLNTGSDKNTVANVVSLVFTNNKDIYHIQIPLVISSKVQPSDVNPFLRSWLDPSTVTKDSFSINQLLIFKQTSKIEFDRFTFTMNYNQTTTPSVARTTGIASFTGKYTLCLLKTPHFIIDYPSLASNDLSSFNDVFNYVMQSTFSIANPRFPLQTSPDIYMLANSSSKYPLPAFYSIRGEELAKVNLSEGFSDSCASGATGRLLNSVKCYPIDLVSQVDGNGDIYVDEATAKPINVKNITQPMDTLTVPPLNPSPTNYTFIIIIVVLVLLGLLVMIGIVYAVFRTSKSASASASPPGSPSGSAMNASTPSVGRV